MHIVHICLCGVFTEGLTYQENLLTKYHKRLGHEVSVITHYWIYNSKGEIVKADKQDNVNEDGVRIIRVNCKNTDNFFAKVKTFEGVLPLLEELSPDVIFIHGTQMLGVFDIIKYLKKHKNVVAYADNHADYSNSARTPLSKHILHGILWRFTSKRIYPYVKKFYGVLPARVDFLVERYHLPKEKLALLVMGVDDDDIAKLRENGRDMDLRTRLGYSPEDFVIVTGGKLDTPKIQTFNLMKAVRESDDPHVKLLIFGSVDKPYQETFEQLRECDKIQYVGWADTQQAFSYFSMADMVCFPGRHSVYWEQVVALRRPMICKYWDGTTHIDIGGNVKFLYKDSVEELSEVLKELAPKGEAFKEMEKAAASDAADEFLYSTIAVRSLS